MGHRAAKILWLKDMLEQLRKAQQQLEWTDNSESIHLLTETMSRDLEACQRICEEIKRRACVRQLV